MQQARKTHTVSFEPARRRAEATEGEDLLTVARRAGADVESSCGGKGTCGKCRVQVASGEGTPPTEAENRLLDAQAAAAGLRLACQTRVTGDMLVRVPEQSRRAATVGVKQPRRRARHLDPAVRTYLVTPPTGAAGAGPGGAEDLVAALAQQHGLRGLTVQPVAAAAWQSLSRGPAEPVVAVVWQPREQKTPAEAAARAGAVLDVRPASAPGRVLGLALDVGTTTIAAYLADLTTGEIVASQAALNPQVSYGDDIISRLQYAAHHEGGAAELQSKVVEEVDRLARSAAQQSGTEVTDIYDVVMVGNTAIHHLFLGIDSTPLRRAPFEPAVKAATETTASAVGLHLHPECRLYALPNEAGFVGADNVAVIIAEEPYRHEEVALLIDVGTNGELVLGSSRRMLSASCATGPAFEGAHIEYGMRAAPGAIERVRIDPETLETRFKVIGQEAWSDELPADQVKARGICGSGVIEAAAEMLKCGVILPDGGFAPHLTAHPRVLLDEGRPRRLVLATAEQSATGRPITVSLKDIRALQLGKAALRAGAEILLSQYGIEQPDRVVLAGAFGTYIDKGAALAIGMLPACEPSQVTSVGNAAGDGALLALLSLAKRREAEWAAETVEYVELASFAGFQQQYMEAMRFEASGGVMGHNDSGYERTEPR